MGLGRMRGLTMMVGRVMITVIGTVVTTTRSRLVVVVQTHTDRVLHRLHLMIRNPKRKTRETKGLGGRLVTTIGHCTETPSTKRLRQLAMSG